MAAQTWLSNAAAVEIIGSLGYPSKMPGTSYGIPTAHCRVGSLLKRIKGSTCESCYADETKLRGRYGAQSVRVGQEKRLASLGNPRWALAMASALLHAHGFIGRKKVAAKLAAKAMAGAGWHRWHDAGDLQDMAHLLAIVMVCELTPQISHWLPTREAALVHAYEKRYGAFPANLCVRVSATMIDGAASSHFANTSTVHRETEAVGWRCVAPDQDGVCGDCRKCWDRGNANTAYHLHN
jgi:hypothetical protein